MGQQEREEACARAVYQTAREIGSLRTDLGNEQGLQLGWRGKEERIASMQVSVWDKFGGVSLSSFLLSFIK